MGFASNTSVSTERSRAELEKLLRAAGSTAVMVGNNGHRIIVGFELQGRTVRLTLGTPTIKEILETHSFNRRWNKTRRAYDSGEARAEIFRLQEERRLWRVLVLVTKAKLEAIAQGLSTVEHEFLADVVVKGGRTVGDVLRGELESIYKGGNIPRLLLGA